MTYTDDHFITEIKQGGIRQEQAIRQLYEQCFFNGHGKLCKTYWGGV